MKRHRHVAPILVTLLTAAILVWMTSPVLAGKPGRWAGRGAAGGAVLGLLVGGDLGSAAEGAAIGAAGGAAAGAISQSRDRRRAQQEELDDLRRQEAERRAAEEAERRAPQQQAPATSMPPDLPQTDEAWVAAIGQDNVNALDALIDCQHARARLLAQAAATVDDRDHRLVARWIEALVELDRRNQAEAERLYEALIPLDDDVDTLQQASLLADQALLEVRRVRREEGGHCGTG